jgi:hypothetical protein
MVCSVHFVYIICHIATAYYDSKMVSLVFTVLRFMLKVVALIRWCEGAGWTPTMRWVTAGDQATLDAMVQALGAGIKVREVATA